MREDLPHDFVPFYAADTDVYTIKQPPPPAGCWVIGDSLRFYIDHKPRWLTRFLCKWLLEWQWENAA